LPTSSAQLPIEHIPESGRDLQTEAAHIFNAFGFFSADQLNQRAVIDGAVPLPNDTEMYEPGAHHSVPSPRSTPTDATCEGKSDTAIIPSAFPPALGKLAAHQSQSVRQPDGPKGPSPDRASIDPFLQAIENRLENEPEHTEQARGSSSKNFEQLAEQRDRVTLKIAEHTVELIGRLQNLSEEEKQRLFDALDELLATHGLTLGSATLNGAPVIRDSLGGAQ
jgi:hypothetical protein